MQKAYKLHTQENIGRKKQTLAIACQSTYLKDTWYGAPPRIPSGKILHIQICIHTVFNDTRIIQDDTSMVSLQRLEEWRP